MRWKYNGMKWKGSWIVFESIVILENIFKELVWVIVIYFVIYIDD